MNQKLLDIVNQYAEQGVPVSEKDVEFVYDFCIVKMNMLNIQNKEEYLPLLFEDELKNYLFRTMINASSLAMRIGKEIVLNV